MPEEPSDPARRFLTTATDPRMSGWFIQIVIGLGYLGQAALTPSSASVVGLMAASAVAWLSQWGLTWVSFRLFLARPWWRRHRRTSTLVILLIIVVSTGVAAMIPGAATSDGWTVVWRFAITLVFTAVLVILADYRLDMTVQRQAQAQLETARAQGIDVIGSLREQIVERMLQMLGEAFAASSPDAKDSERIRGFARDQVRPLSHELAEAMPPVTIDRPAVARGFTWRAVLGEVSARPLIRPLAMAIVVTLLFIFTTVEVTSGSPLPPGPADSGVGVRVDLAPLLVALASLGMVFFTTLCVAWLVVRLVTPVLPRLSLGSRVLLALGSILLVAVSVVLVVQLVDVALPLSDDSSGSLNRRLWLALPIVAIAFLIVITRSISELLRDSTRRMRLLTDQLEWETTRLDNAISQERQFFATQLHGPIQSAAAAAALRWESGAPSIETLERVRRDLEETVQALGDGPPQHRNVRAEIRNLTDTWEGVCQIRVSMPDSVIIALDRDWVAAGTVLNFVTEAVANAAMHGRASHVEIDVLPQPPDEITITVVNDGHLELGEGRGLGSAMLDATCVRWSRQVLEGCVVLRAVIAVPELAGV